MPHLDMSHLDSNLIKFLAVGFLVLLWIARGAKFFNITVYQIKTDKPQTTKINSTDDAIKALDRIKEQISQSGGPGVHVTVHKTGAETMETEIRNPEEEMKIINDIEENLKNGTPLTPNASVIVRTNLRKSFQVNFNKQP